MEMVCIINFKLRSTEKPGGSSTFARRKNFALTGRWPQKNSVVYVNLRDICYDALIVIIYKDVLKSRTPDKWLFFFLQENRNDGFRIYSFNSIPCIFVTS